MQMSKEPKIGGAEAQDAATEEPRSGSSEKPSETNEPLVAVTAETDASPFKCGPNCKPH